MTQTTFELAGHVVRRVGFGAMQLPGPGVMGPPRDHDRALAVLRRTVELGINHIDTAEFYGPHIANQLIRQALHPYADDLVLVSKVGAYRDARGAWLPAQRPQQLVDAVHENLSTLGVERLAIVNLRRIPAEEHPSVQVPLESQLAAMRSLVEEGSIEAFGISNVDTAEAAMAIDAGAVCVQNAHNLLSRDDQPTLALCAERGVAYVPFFPLGSGFPGMPKVTEDPRVISVAAQLGATPAQVGLAWLLAQGEHVLLIPGTSSVAHLEENTASGDLQLTEEQLSAVTA